MFAPDISDFWFVDTEYFTRRSAFDETPPIAETVNMRHLGFEVLGPPLAKPEFRIDPKSKHRYPYIEPCVRKDRYLHAPTGREIAVRRRRGYGEKSIEHLNSINVFFHRGDSIGESGSNVRWLSHRRRSLIMSRLVDGGLVVSDGSLANVKQVARLADSKESSEKTFRTAEDFVTWQRKWRCVGWMKRRYGPTLIWRLDIFVDA